MPKIKLDSRLEAVASLVRQESVVADIGTDHGYLVCYLLQNGKCNKGIAADLRKGPLENAKQTVLSCSLEDRISLVLSDGLTNIEENSCNEIVIAGMGGILISEIIEKAKWVYNKDIHIIAQPMTHAEYLRKFLCENGFVIDKEITATDSKHCYCVISFYYNGTIKEYPESYFYLGELLKNKDDVTKKYINKLVDTLEKKLQAQKSADVKDYDKLERLLNEIKTKITEVGLYD